MRQGPGTSRLNFHASIGTDRRGGGVATFLVYGPREGLRATGVLDRERAMEAYHALGRIVGQSLDPIAAAASLHVELEWRAASRYVDRAGVEHETSTDWTSDRAWCERFITVKREKMPEADTWLESRAISAPQRVEP
jgi:hypothetical protein